MTAKLTGNFLATAHCLIFEDSASVTWAFSPNTNELTATSSGGGGGGSSANPSATIGLSAVNGSAATFMTSDSAPPLSQGIVPTWTGAHTFNSTVTIGGSGNDSGIIFTGSSGYINASGATGLTIAATHAFTVSAANYTFEIGGSSIWTMDASGGVTQQAAAGETSLVVYGAANYYVQQLVGSSTNNESFGLLLQAGTSSSDYNVRFESYAAGVLATLYGDGGLAVGAAPTGASTGIGTINVAGGYYINGTALSFTSLSPLTTEGDLIYENATPAPARLAIGGTGTFLTVAAGIPAWSTATIPGTATKGDLWYASAANVMSALAVGTTGQLLTVAGGVPAWEAIPTWNQNTTGSSASCTGNAATATNVAASGITGTTLAASVVASSLTSFGASIALGTPASGNLTNCTFPTLNQSTTGNAASATVATNLGGAPVGGSFKVGGSSWLRTIIRRGLHTVDLARQPATTLAAKAIWASYFFPAQAGSIPFQTAANTTELLPYSQPGLYLTSNASGAPQWTLPSANPSGLVGLTAIVGSAVTFLRSDAAPALNVTISPTWTGQHTFANANIVLGTAATGTTITQLAGAVAGTTHTIAGSNAGTAANTGGPIAITGGTGNTSGNGGAVTITGGTAGSTGAGGAANLVGGTPIAGTGGAVFVAAAAGVGTAQTGGAVTISGGAGTTSGAGGNVTIKTGVSPTGTAGSIVFQAGTTANVTALTIAPTGGVTIATPNAVSVSALTIDSFAAGTAINMTDGTVTSGIGTGGSVLQIGTTSNNAMSFYSDNVTRITIAAAGSVTIAQPSSGTVAALNLPASTATIPMLAMAAGTVLTSAAAGNFEYDGTNSYFTNETTSGRGLIPVEQIFHLAADGGGITTIANFFGTTSNISLVSGGYYEIEIVLYYTVGSTGSVVTWTLTNSAAPTSMDLYYEMCPITGIVAPPGTATTLVGQILGGVTAAQTVATGALTASTSQYARFRIMLKNGTGTSLKIQATETTQTTAITPKLGSYWKCKRIPAGNVGTFAA